MIDLTAYRSDGSGGRLSGLRLAAVSAAALIVAPVQAADLRPLLDICTASPDPGIDARAVEIATLGYERVESETAAWVQGQVLHLAMSALERQSLRIRNEYDFYNGLAADDDLFLKNIDQVSFAEPSGAFIYNYSIIDGLPGCSFAFAPGQYPQNIPLEAAQTWTHGSGTFTSYNVPDNLGSGSTFDVAIWQEWIDGDLLVSGFLTLSK